MDAVKFLKEQARMCRSFGGGCGGCPLRAVACSNIEDSTGAEKRVEAIEKWSKEHPVKTRMSEFMKQYPNALVMDADNLPLIKPCYIDASIKDKLCESSLPCSLCREKYWLEEIE